MDIRVLPHILQGRNSIHCPHLVWNRQTDSKIERGVSMQNLDILRYVLVFNIESLVSFHDVIYLLIFMYLLLWSYVFLFSYLIQYLLIYIFSTILESLGIFLNHSVWRFAVLGNLVCCFFNWEFLHFCVLMISFYFVVFSLWGYKRMLM